MLSVAAAVVGVAVMSQFIGTENSVRMEGPDGHDYDMQNLPNKEEAVKLMSKIRANLTKLRDTYSAEPALMNSVWLTAGMRWFSTTSTVSPLPST